MQTAIHGSAPALSTGHDYQSEEELFLTFCERYAATLKEQVLLLTRDADARSVGDEDALEEIADAIDDNEAERRLLLCHIYDMAECCNSEGDHG